MGHSSPELTKFTQLTLTNIPPDEWEHIITVDIKRILNIAQIYHLIISVKNIYIGILIPIINSLPELLSLQIHSLSFDEPEHLMDCKDTGGLFLTENKSKITKVRIEKLYDMKDIYFLTMLCPQIECLKTECIKDNMYVESFLQDFLEKSNYEDNHFARPLCIHVLSSNN
jgi:hypothetical protein